MGKCCSIATLLLDTMFVFIINGPFMKVDASPYSSDDIDAALKILSRPALKTIHSDDGDVIDCVDIYKQPAFDHPALKNHKIQMAPSFIPGSRDSKTKNNESVSTNKPIISQIWHRNGTYCPNGTIPIRRIQRKDLLRAHSLHRFGTKPSLHFTNSSLKPNFSNKLALPIFENSSAALLATMGYSYIGAQAELNIWNPSVDLTDDFTTSQMWLKSGNGAVFESVESGWVVNPKLYGDRATRLFAYWTRDSYWKTGCFDLTCSGFVQTGTQVALGAALEPYSSISGPQYGVKIAIFLDPSTSNWWLIVAGNIPIGYWPPSLFKTLADKATLVQWGGEVFSSEVRKTPHTATVMGSGEEARHLFGKAAFIQNIRIMDYSLTLKYPEFVSEFANEPYCYSAYNYAIKIGAEPIFYYGGPGRNPPYCP